MNLPHWNVAQDKIEAKNQTIDLWLINLNPAEFQFPSLKNELYSEDELDRAARFRFDRHRRQYLVGRGGLRRILAKYSGMTPENIKFDYGEFGKPSLKGKPIEFNLSNSADMALVAVTSMPGGVGADIEYRDRHLWEIDSLADTVFTDEEVTELNEYNPDQRLIPFLSGWTRKEAYLKGIGKGLALPLKQFSVQLANDLRHPRISVSDWHLFSFWAADNFLSAVAYPKVETPPDFRWFKLDDL